MNAQQPWTVDDEEAKVMYLFLSSLPATEPAAVPMTVPAVAADLPAGDAGAGAAVYAQSCQLCHGAVHTGEGRLADRITSLPDEELAFLDSYGFDATQKRVTFIEKVRHGGFLGLYGNMPLYSTEVMSDAQLGDLNAFLGLY
jgi:thiosulfate dehydrogenase